MNFKLKNAKFQSLQDRRENYRSPTPLRYGNVTKAIQMDARNGIPDLKNPPNDKF